MLRKTQTATALGSQQGRPTVLRAQGALVAFTTLTMHTIMSLSKSRLTWLATREDTLVFGFSVFIFNYDNKSF
jgi:hypothetical protein